VKFVKLVSKEVSRLRRDEFQSIENMVKQENPDSQESQGLTNTEKEKSAEESFKEIEEIWERQLFLSVWNR
jgi:hypothetical protein